MTGDPEEEHFYRIAGRLKKYVWQVKDDLPWSEVVGWKAIFDKELEEPTPEHRYLANIAFQIYLLRASLPFTGFKPEKTFEDFLLKVKKEAPKDDTVVGFTKDGRPINETWMKKIKAKEKALAAVLGVGPGGIAGKKDDPPTKKPVKKGRKK